MNQTIIKDILQGKDVLCPICKQKLEEVSRDDQGNIVLRRYYCPKCKEELTVANEMKPIRASFKRKTYQLHEGRSDFYLETV